MIFNFHFENDLDARHLEEQRKALDLWLNDHFFVNHDYNHRQFVIANMMITLIIFNLIILTKF